ncbi:alpha/beta hydrolase [soil metagenome]
MTLEPRVRRLVATLNALDRRGPETTMVERRVASAATSRRLGGLVMPKGPEPASQVDHLAPVERGRITVRIYRPHGTGPFPLHVFLHGGGWCLGTLDERDPRCRAIATGAEAVVASVDYRMAPENAYPTAPQDCYEALRWLVDHAAELDVDASRVSVGGESAGANLATVLCLMSRDRSGPTISYQWLDVPATDLTMSLPSITSTPSGLLLDHEDMVRYRDHYLTDLAQATEAYASPLHADDLRGLPPAWIMTCGNDPLRDDGTVYADALEAAGVTVQRRRLEGHVHPSFAFTRVVPSAAAYEREAITALRRALHP